MTEPQQTVTEITPAADWHVNTGPDKTFVLEYPCWEVLRVVDLAVPGGATKPDLKPFGPSGDLKVRTFKGKATSQQGYFSVKFPQAWAEGTVIYPFVCWTPTTADAGNVKWFLEYSWTDREEVFTASTTISVVEAAGGTAWRYRFSNFESIDGTEKHIGAEIVCRIYRDPGDAEDTYEHDVSYLQTGFQVQQDTFGSRTRLAK